MDRTCKSFSFEPQVRLNWVVLFWIRPQRPPEDGMVRHGLVETLIRILCFPQRTSVPRLRPSSRRADVPFCLMTSYILTYSWNLPGQWVGNELEAFYSLLFRWKKWTALQLLSDSSHCRWVGDFWWGEMGEGERSVRESYSNGTLPSWKGST